MQDQTSPIRTFLCSCILPKDLITFLLPADQIPETKFYVCLSPHFADLHRIGLLSLIHILTTAMTPRYHFQVSLIPGELQTLVNAATVLKYVWTDVQKWLIILVWIWNIWRGSLSCSMLRFPPRQVPTKAVMFLSCVVTGKGPDYLYVFWQQSESSVYSKPKYWNESKRSLLQSYRCKNVRLYVLSSIRLLVKINFRLDYSWKKRFLTTYSTVSPVFQQDNTGAINSKLHELASEDSINKV